MSTRSQPLPPETLLARYEQDPTAYTDCFVAEVDHAVGLEAFLPAFYNSWLFRLERVILSVLLKRPSQDGDAAELARGLRETYAAWHVEARAEQEILLCDHAGRTRSWFLVQPQAAGTRLYFGSAVVPSAARRARGEPGLGLMFALLRGFHILYSRALLGLAVARLGEPRRNQAR